MNTDHEELRARLQGFSIDAHDAAFPFSARLARENDWSPGYARRVIEEYKRFAFLSVAADHPVSPSEAVDEAWHLHLTYTQNYWKEFCGEILRKPLHHHPTKGGATEHEKFGDWYRRTLESYRHFFEEEPPADIWPDPHTKQTESHYFVRVDKNRNWVIPKPKFGPRRRRTVLFGMLAAMTVASVAAEGGMNPFDFRGPEFLCFYAALSVTVFAAAAWLRWVLRQPSQCLEPGNLDPYEMAYLREGPMLVVNTAVANLVNQKLIQVFPRHKCLKVIGVLPKGCHPVERAVFAASNRTEGEEIGKVRFALKSFVGIIADKLKERGLVVGDRQAAMAIGFPLVLTAIVPITGLIKIFIGINRDRPVEYLVVLTVITTVTMFLGFARRPRRSRRGDAVLKRLQERHTDLKRVWQPAVLAPTELAMAVGLFGLTALNGSELSTLRKDLRLPTDGSHGGHGCSSGCGGAGCGGGGGGGSGCGGCGGH